MKKLTILIILFYLTSLAYTQSVDVKDDGSNSLITINDEGTAGSITIPDATSVGTPTSKLYNEGGTLKWNGTVLATGSSLWTLGGGNVYRSTGNVGIGTTSPDSKHGRLHVRQTNGDDGDAMVVEHTNSIGYASIRYINNGSKRFNVGVGGTDATFHGLNDKFYIHEDGAGPIQVWTSSGNVGIGNTNPSRKLYIKSTGYDGVVIQSTEQSQLTFLPAVGSPGDGFVMGRSQYGSDAHNFFIYDEVAGTSRLFIGGTGNVGIGTTDPGRKLHVKGNAQVESDGTWQSGATARLWLGPDNNMWIEHIHSGGLNIETADSWPLSFSAGGTENMRINGNGNVGIGTTNPTSKLSIVGLSEYADNTAAVAAGLTAGDLYRSGDILKIVH